MIKVLQKLIIKKLLWGKNNQKYNINYIFQHVKLKLELSFSFAGRTLQAKMKDTFIHETSSLIVTNAPGTVSISLLVLIKKNSFTKALHQK